MTRLFINNLGTTTYTPGGFWRFHFVRKEQILLAFYRYIGYRENLDSYKNEVQREPRSYKIMIHWQIGQERFILQEGAFSL